MNPYYKTPDRVANLLATVKSWMGTPFRDQWCCRGIGVDCIQFAAVAYIESGALQPFQKPPYTLGGWKGLKKSPILEWIEQSGSFVEIGTSGLQIGDLLCFNTGRIVYHIGIYVDGGHAYFVHAIPVDKVCERTLLDPTWASRFVTAYRPIER